MLFMLLMLIAIFRSDDVLRACGLAGLGIVLTGQGVLALTQPRASAPVVLAARASLAVLGLVTAVLLLVWIARTVIN